MGEVIRLLHTRRRPAGVQARYVWLEAGESLSLSRCVIRVSFDRYDETYVPSVLVLSPHGRQALAMVAGWWTDLPDEPGLAVTLRAAAMDGRARPVRLLLEFADRGPSWQTAG